MISEDKKTLALSLFAGIGGFEVGMSLCGFSFVNTLEWDEKCCVTLNMNKQLTGSIEYDIKPIDIMETLPHDFSKMEVDYIVGGPPCQSFSAAGRRAGGVAGISDIRGTLFGYYCQYVKHFTPKAFVFENVRGILSSNKGEDFKIICSSFEEVGYNLFWKVLNAADYGVPQLRERVFLVGIRKDLNIDFKFPAPTHGIDSPNKKAYVTVKEALADIDNSNEITPPYGGKYGHLLPEIPPGENYRYYTEEMGHPEPLFAWRSKFSNFLYKMDPDDLCRTIIAYQGKYDGPFHWRNRKCEIDELIRLQGFPSQYVIPHSYTEAVKQIGNSVCPPVAHQIGKALRYQVEGLENMKVPLIDSNLKLSFDKRKGVKAKQTKAKKANRYSDLMQMNIFDQETPIVKGYTSFQKNKTIDDRRICWVFENGKLTIELHNGTNRTEKVNELHLKFFGGVASAINEVVAKSYSDRQDNWDLRMLWSEIHSAIQEITSYDSLLPLYGHFTEPYPKFTVTFTTDIDSPITRFQKLALDKTTSNKILKYDVIDPDNKMAEQYLKDMREYGFDVRTHNTNRTIPVNHFRVCYPFTMPTDLKVNISWEDIL